MENSNQISDDELLSGLDVEFKTWDALSDEAMTFFEGSIDTKVFGAKNK